MSERPRRIEVTDPVEITVDGETVVAQRGELLIDACERNGAYIPRFCYHPRMQPVGMCRMCLVEVDSGRGPALQPSCMIPVGPDMTVSTTTERVTKAQDGVLEFLLANHPLDCPVCDKGGECPLQDQTLAYGPGESRWVEEKRHYEKPIPISDTVMLDRERCILCDRCTRFASEVADDPLIHFIHRGANTEVNTFPGEPFSSYFSGNTVQICPVGALTAKPYRFRARPWDLEEVESTCTTCSVGCRMAVQSSRNQVVRYQGVDSDPVNWSWLCDKGRFGFESLNHPDRLGEPLVRDGDELRPARWGTALRTAAELLRSARDDRGPGSIAVIGGARLTNESAYAWARLAKGVLGTDHVDAQLDDGLPAEVLDLPGATIDDVCRPGGTVLWIGPDPKEQLPVLFLRAKHAALADGARIVEVTPTATGLTPYAEASVRPRPGELGAVVRALVTGEIPVDGAGGVTAEDLRAASAVVRDAGDALTVVVGRANLAESADVVLDAAAAVAAAVPGARFLPALRRGNVRGAIEMGLAPGRLPGRARLADGEHWATAWGRIPGETGLDTAGILDAAAAGRIDVLVLLGADPLADVPDRGLARRGMAGARHVIALDLFLTDSVRQADVVLPVSGFAETDGTTTNLEGRVTVLNAKVTPPGTARADWMVAADLAHRLDGDLGVVSGARELWDQVAAGSPVHAGVATEALGHPDAADGLLVDLDGPGLAPRTPAPAPRTDAYSLRLVVDRTLYDDGVLVAHSPSMVPSRREAAIRLSVADAAALGVLAGDRIRLTGERGALSGVVAVDAGLARGTVAVPHRTGGTDPGELLAAGEVACDVRVEVA
jgi:NADH-quinone oxidoreductase subunit G